MMNIRKLPLLLMTFLALALLISLSGCVPEPQIPAEYNELYRQVEEGTGTREAVEASFNKMDIPKLVEHLEKDSVEGIEPFNSLAYRELITRGPEVGDELKAFIKAPNRTSFLTLLALRKVNLDVYQSVERELGVAILIDAFLTSESFNTWGLPHLYWEDAAEALIEYGEAALKPLMELLDDERAAPVWGSEETFEYERYQYRVKDYAWVMVMHIRGERIEIPLNPAERDRLISIQMDR